MIIERIGRRDGRQAVDPSVGINRAKKNPLPQTMAMLPSVAVHTPTNAKFQSKSGDLRSVRTRVTRRTIDIIMMLQKV